MSNMMIKNCKHFAKPIFRFWFYQARKMSLSQVNEADTNHLTITANQERSNVTTKTTVTKISNVSPTVKLLTLQVENPQFTFKAGQWVDLFIPDINMVGGFSMCSSPLRKETFDLAVKFSNHPPSYWVHTKCEVGMQLSARSGGDFHFHLNSQSKPASLLLLAGGVGINPLASIIHYLADLRRKAKEGVENTNLPAWHGKLALLYSSRTQEELLFMDEFTKICSESRDFQFNYFVTRQTNIEKNSQVTGGHMTKQHIENALSWLKSSTTDSQVLSYICGPSGMIETMESHLLSLQLPKDSIHYEKWWVNLEQ